MMVFQLIRNLGRMFDKACNLRRMKRTMKMKMNKMALGRKDEATTLSIGSVRSARAVSSESPRCQCLADARPAPLNNCQHRSRVVPHLSIFVRSLLPFLF